MAGLQNGANGTKLSSHSWVSLALVISMVTVTAWLATDRAELQQRVRVLEKAIPTSEIIRSQLAEIIRRQDIFETMLDRAAADRWKGTDMKRWAARLRDANVNLTGLKVPDPITDK